MSRSARGMSLIEILVAMAIMVFAVVIASMLVVEGARLTRQGEETVKANDASRMAGEAIIGTLQLAGMGASTGLNVAVGGTSMTVPPLFGVDSTDGGSDDLYVVVPARRVMKESCVDQGAAVRVEKDYIGAGLLEVNCIGSLTGASLLMVSGMRAGAILTAPTLSPGMIDSPDLTVPSHRSVAADEVTGVIQFRKGDMVFPVTVVHFFVGTDIAGNPALMQANAVPASTGTFPWVDVAAVPIVSGIEDLQVTFGSDTGTNLGAADPNNITWAPGAFAAIPAGTVQNTLRSVRFGVVSVAANPSRNSQGQILTDTNYARLPNENNIPATPPDGRRRVLFSRRVELPNFAPNNL